MKLRSKDWGNNFQTPEPICRYMSSFLPAEKAGTILEPTHGKGNLVKVLNSCGYVFAPDDFNKVNGGHYDWVVMNPPFSPMKRGYDILYKCMGMTDNIIALMPYLAVINGEKRTMDIFNYGLKSITHLPRSTFKGSRVQTCILEMKKGYKEKTEFKLLPKSFH